MARRPSGRLLRRSRPEPLAIARRRTPAEAAATLSETRWSEQTFRSMVEHSPDIVVRFDRACRRVYANPAYGGMIGPPELYLGATPTERPALQLPVATAYQRWLETVIATGRPAETELSVETVRGRRWFSVRAVPELDATGRVDGVLTVAHDVTARVRAETAARDSKARADTANRAKSQFLANMSHELRTPLNAIIGFADLLAINRGGRLSAREQSYCHDIAAAGRHLQQLVDDILDLASVESGGGHLAFGVVAVADVLDQTERLTRPLAERAGIRLAVSGRASPALCADQRRLIQILVNLVSNGIKYNHPGGLVTLTAEAIGDRIRFVVADTGVGIAEDKQDRLFVPFERLGAEATGVEGTGIGLVLVKNFVEAMKGAMGFISQPDAGSQFWVEFPRWQGAVDAGGCAEAALAP